VVAVGIYDLYRLRRYLYLHHPNAYERLRGEFAGRPRLFGSNPGGREFTFIFKGAEDFGDPEVARLRNRVRRIPLNAVILMGLGLAGGLLLVFWKEGIR
jgi:hypothetical protein